MDTFRVRQARVPAGAWLLACSAWALSACDALRPAREGGVDQQTFVSVFVELRRAAAEAPTDAAFALRREEILREHGVTEASLERFIEDHADDLEYLSDVWDRIDRTLRGELDKAGDPVPAAPVNAEDDGGDP